VPCVLQQDWHTPLATQHRQNLLRTCLMGLSETRPGTPVEVRKVQVYLDGPECVINTPESEGLAGDELERSGMSGGLDDKYDKVEDEKSESSEQSGARLRVGRHLNESLVMES